MGSDMSRPKNRRLQKIGEIDGLYSKSAIYRDPTGNCGCGCGTMGGFNPCMPTCSPMPLCQPANLNLNLAATPQTTRHYYPSHYTMMPAEPMSIQCVVNSSHRKSLPMECLDMSPNTSGSMLALQPQPQPQQPSLSTCRSTNRCNNVVDMSPPCPSTPCHRSRCSSPITASTTISTSSPPCHPKPVYYDTTDCRQPRYRTVKPHMMSRRAQLDDEIYCSDRSRGGGGGSTCGEGSMSSSSGSGRHFTITKTYHQPMVYDEVEKNVRLPAEADMIPTDRIYEIRKEKIMIKADRNSSLSPVPHGAAIHHHHPPHHHAPPPPSSLRSKSSDRYIDVPKSVRIIDEFGRPASYETDCEESFAPPRVHNSRLKSRSGYVINSDYETTSKSYLENYIETNTKVINPPSGLIESAVLNSAIKRAAPPTSNSNNCNEIIYVPMVKEEFIKRESSKHCHQPPLPSFEPADNLQKSNQNANQKFWQQAPPPVNPKTTTNKIIIKEISPLNQFAKSSTANLVSSKTTTTTTTNATNTSNTQPPKKSSTLFNSDSFFAPRKSILKNTFQSSSQQQIQKQTDLEEDEGEEIVVNNMRNSDQLHQQQVDQMIVNVTNNNALRNSSSYSNTNLNGDSHRKSSSNLLNSNNNNNSVSYGIIKEGKFFNINDAALL